MSSNRTSISDNMNTAHRQRPDEPDKQQQHNAQANATNNKQSSKSHKHSSHDECDIIGEIIGKYGKYQFFMTFLLSLFQVPNTFHISSTIYQVSLPAHSIFNLAQVSHANGMLYVYASTIHIHSPPRQIHKIKFMACSHTHLMLFLSHSPILPYFN